MVLPTQTPGTKNRTKNRQMEWTPPPSPLGGTYTMTPLTGSWYRFTSSGTRSLPAKVGLLRCYCSQKDEELYKSLPTSKDRNLTSRFFQTAHRSAWLSVARRSERCEAELRKGSSNHIGGLDG